MKNVSRKRRGISKVAEGDQHGIFQHFQSNTTDYATRERYLSQRGGEASGGRDTDSLYNIAPEGAESRVPTEYVAPHLSTRYSPDRVGIQAQRLSDGVYQDPYTNKVYDYNEGFKTEDGRSFPGGSASLQSSLMRAANVLDTKGFSKEADRLDGVLRKVAGSFMPKKIEPFRVKITGGRFEGGQGLVTDRYDDGVLGIDLDQAMEGMPAISADSSTPRGFAAEDQIERVEEELSEPRSDIAGEWLGVPSAEPMDLAGIIRSLVLAHRDPASDYKLSDDRLHSLTESDLTKEEEEILGVEITSLAHVTRTLTSVANALDTLGLNGSSDELDLTISALAEKRKVASRLLPITRMASSLDERGLDGISDVLDVWLSKNQ
jgi:hypothetical protein